MNRRSGRNKGKQASEDTPVERKSLSELRDMISPRALYALLGVPVAVSTLVACVVLYVERGVIERKEATIQSLNEDLRVRTSRLDRVSSDVTRLTGELSQTSKQLMIAQSDLHLIRNAMQQSKEFTIVCVADFAGPQGDGLTNIVLSELSSLSTGHALGIVPLRQSYSERDELGAIRAAGGQFGASMLLWGWQVAPGEGSLVSTHLELLDSRVPEYLRESDFKNISVMDLDDPTSITMLLKVGSELSYAVGLVAALDPYLRGDYKEACDTLGRLLQRDSDAMREIPRAYVRYFLGASLLRLGEYGAADGMLEEALRLSPGLGEAHYGRGTLALRIGLVSKAEECFSECLRLDAQHGRARNNRGVARARLGRHDEAGDDFEQALGDVERDASSVVLGNMARSALELGDFDRSIELATQSIELHIDPDACYIRALARLGKHGQQMGLTKPVKENLEAAASDLTTAMALGGDPVELLAKRGEVFFSLERFDEARSDFDILLSMQDDVKARVLRGGILVDIGRVAEGNDDLQRAADLIANRELGALCYYHLGVVRFRSGNSEGAQSAFDVAIGLSPSAKHYSARAFVFSSSSRWAEAVADLTKCIELDPRDVLALHNRGTARARLGRFDGAIEDFTSIIGIRPDSPEAYYYRSRALLEVGDLNGAKRDAGRLQELCRSDAVSSSEVCRRVEELLEEIGRVEK